MATKDEIIQKSNAAFKQINDDLTYLDTEVKKRALSTDIPSVGNGALTIKKNNTALGTFTANATTATTVNISVPTTVAELSDASNYALKSDVSSAVVPKGSVATVASLPAASESTLGYMYNFSAEFTTTSDFVEGSGKKYPEGTNVVVVEYSEGVYKYDIFAGFVNTSAYDSHIANSTIHVTATEKATWNDKQDALTQAQLTNIANVTNKANTSDVYSKTDMDAYLSSCFNTTIVVLGTSS